MLLPVASRTVSEALGHVDVTVAVPVPVYWLATPGTNAPKLTGVSDSAERARDRRLDVAVHVRRAEDRERDRLGLRDVAATVDRAVLDHVVAVLAERSRRA